MSLKIGIVGLPNVGKSTLFNALIKGQSAQAENYPFCTIDPNVGVIEVPDERLQELAKVSESKKIIPAVVEFVDIAGLVRGANKGEGLGNKFLSHIREVDAIAMVVRFFEDNNIQHVSNKLDPLDDIQVVETELQLADLEIVSKRLGGIDSEIRSGSKTAPKEKVILEKIKNALDNGRNAREVEIDDEEKLLIKSLSLLTQKPILYIANISENQLKDAQNLIKGKINDEKYKFIPISAKIESELNSLSDSDKKEYLESLGIANSGRDQLIKEAYKVLGLITFFTSGEPETRAWTTRFGAKAPEAAGVIHTDFEHGFISSDIIFWKDLVETGGWNSARSKGLVRMEGKDYQIVDGDVCLFKFNV